MTEEEVVGFVEGLTTVQRANFLEILDNLENRVEPVNPLQTVEDVARDAVENLAEVAG